MNQKKIISYIKKTQIDKSPNDIIVNYNCFCSKSFYSTEKLLYILPCSHIVHEKCFNDYILKYQYKKLFSTKNSSFNPNQNYNLNNDLNNILKCPCCNNNIQTVLTENKINSKKKYLQYKIDIKSIKLDNSASINYLTLPLGMIKLTSFINKLIIANTGKDLLNTIEYIFSSLNIKINIIDNTKNNPIIIKDNQIYWKNKKDNTNKLVIISNHSHYIDSIILHYLFRCGFVSSDFINQTDIGKIIATKLKLLIFKRGVDTNMVEKIKKYLDEQKRIVIYPEGTFSNNETMIRFRTGAFHVGETICPVIIKYNKIVYDDDFKQMLFKLLTQNEIIVNIYINDFIYPPFDDKKIDEVRNHMLKIGKFENSRVSNKTIKE